MENYLVTVDFQQSLALNVQDQKKRQPVDDPAPKETVDLLQGGEASADSAAPGMMTKEPQTDAPDSETASGARELSAQAKAPQKPSRVDGPAWMAKPASNLMGSREKDSPFSGATWVFPMIPPEGEDLPPDSPQPDKDETPPVQTAQAQPETQEPPEPEAPSQDLGQSEKAFPAGTAGAAYGPLAKGEKLLSVSKKLDLTSFDAKQVAVALWMDNPDSFIYGNMNGIKEGAQLNLENLEKRMEDLKPEAANDILHSQWEEWKVIRKKLALTDDETIDTLTQEIQLPSELEEEKGLIFSMLREWKESWEAGDLERHLAFFSDRSQGSPGDAYAETLSLKRRLFARHPHVRLQVHEAFLILKAGQPVVSFGQDFTSGKMESFGRKDIAVAWEGGEWKILNEKFKVKDYLEKDGSSPEVSLVSAKEVYPREKTASLSYVIHASSHLDYATATQAANELKKIGFNAYSYPVYISPRKKIYRVYVGRFPDMELAGELVSELKKFAVSRLAIPVRYPFTFLAGEYGSEEEAETQVRNLRAKGLSPLLFISSDKDFLQPRFRVFLGAFPKKEDAARTARELKSLNLSFDLAAP